MGPPYLGHLALVYSEPGYLVQVYLLRCAGLVGSLYRAVASEPRSANRASLVHVITYVKCKWCIWLASSQSWLGLRWGDRKATPLRTLYLIIPRKPLGVRVYTYVQIVHHVCCALSAFHASPVSSSAKAAGETSGRPTMASVEGSQAVEGHRTLADMPLHAREQEPYSVGPCTQLETNRVSRSQSTQGLFDHQPSAC